MKNIRFLKPATTGVAFSLISLIFTGTGQAVTKFDFGSAGSPVKRLSGHGITLALRG